MIVRVHTQTGTSFAGLAAYLLYDKNRATTSDRLAWAETQNLATQNPHAAWRVMAATAMDQKRLKAEAGIRNSGRKSDAPVLHYTLSWDRSEAPDLSREEMLRAVRGTLRVLGTDRTAKGGRRQFADEHQVLVVCHSDEPHPHVHVVVNRVHPQHGVMLPSSNDRLKLSRWAERYEKERGEVLCEQRVLNNAARGRGKYVRGPQNMPRHIYELASNDNRPDVQQEQTGADRALAKRTEAMRGRQAAELTQLGDQYREERTALRRDGKTDVARARKRAREGFQDKWTTLYHEHQAEVRAFERNERHFLGRAQNVFRVLNLKTMTQSPQPMNAIRGMFLILASSGARLEAIRRAHKEQERALAAKENAAERAAAAQARANLQAKLSQSRAGFLTARKTLLQQHRGERSELRSEWRQRHRDRAAAFADRVATPGELDTKAAATAIEKADRIRQLKERRLDRNRGREPKPDRERQDD